MCYNDVSVIPAPKADGMGCIHQQHTERGDMNRRLLVICALTLLVAGLVVPVRALAASVTIVHSCNTWGEILPCS